MGQVKWIVQLLWQLCFCSVPTGIANCAQNKKGKTAVKSRSLAISESKSENLVKSARWVQVTFPVVMQPAALHTCKGDCPCPASPHPAYREQMHILDSAAVQQRWLLGCRRWLGASLHLPPRRTPCPREGGRQSSKQGEGEIKLFSGTCRRHEHLKNKQQCVFSTSPANWMCLTWNIFNGFKGTLRSSLEMQSK